MGVARRVVGYKFVLRTLYNVLTACLQKLGHCPFTSMLAVWAQNAERAGEKSSATDVGVFTCDVLHLI